MKSFLTFSIVLISLSAFTQKVEDSQIMIRLADSVGIHQKVKDALIKNDFIIKEIGHRDTIITYPRVLTNMNGYAIAMIVINSNNAIITGIYGLKKLNYFGSSNYPRGFKQIVFFNGSKTWPLLKLVADDIGGHHTFSKQ